MSAMQQVFGLNELLEIIICQVDPHQIPELKQVNRTWRETISTSKAVRRARVLNIPETSRDWWSDTEPDTMSNAELKKAVWTALHHHAIAHVIYIPKDWIRLHPGLSSVHSCFEFPNKPRYLESFIRLPTMSSAIELGMLDDFIFNPPCQTLKLRALYWSESDQQWQVPENVSTCWAFNPSGLKIRDVLEVRDLVEATRRLCWNEENGEDDNQVVANFAVDGEYMEPSNPEDRRLHDLYFKGPIPRYRKASHRLDTVVGKEARKRDRDLKWHPGGKCKTWRWFRSVYYKARGVFV